jgi:hypothetical protein
VAPLRAAGRRSRSRAWKEEDARGAKRECARVSGGRGSLELFDPPRSTRDRRSRSDGRGRSASVRAAFGPGGAQLSRPRPRLRPGARVSAPHAP